jgi:hypothetical protein
VAAFPLFGHLLSLESFDKLRAKGRVTSWGLPLHGFLPLGISPGHIQRAASALKEQLMRLCRHPDASVCYTPPFRAEMAVHAVTCLLSSAVAEAATAIDRGFTPLSHSAVGQCFDNYMKVLHVVGAMTLSDARVACAAREAPRAPAQSSFSPALLMPRGRRSYA